MPTENLAFDLLHDIQEQALSAAEYAAQLRPTSRSQRVVAFVVAGQRFFCDASMVKEVAVAQEFIGLPKTKPWLKGLHNSKGVLHSVVDLALLADSERSTATQRGHIMLINHPSRQCALLVNRVIGFRQFDMQADVSNMLDQTSEHWWDSLSEFITSQLVEDNQTWLLLDVTQLIESEVFLEVQ